MKNNFKIGGNLKIKIDMSSLEVRFWVKTELSLEDTAKIFKDANIQVTNISDSIHGGFWVSIHFKDAHLLTALEAAE